jgi:hypothetical protein
MTPRDVIGLWLDRLVKHYDADAGAGPETADSLLKRLDEQGMAVVPKETVKTSVTTAEQRESMAGFGYYPNKFEPK